MSKRDYKGEAFAIANRTKDAYSTLAYRSWRAVAEAVLKMGFTPEETEAILRSKVTRWARDASDPDYRYGTYPASVVVDYIKRYPGIREDAKKWAEEAKARPRA